MTEVSLSTSIFGEKKDKEGGLSSLFDSSPSTLPAKPNNVDFTETKLEKERRERKEEKRRKRKKREDAEDEEAESQYTSKSTSTSPAKKTKAKKPRKPKKEGENEDETEEKADGEDVDKEDAGTSNDEDLTVFVGNLPLDINRQRLESIFRQCGKIKSSRLRSFGTTGVKVAPEHAGNQNLVKKVSVNTKKLMEGSPKKTAQGYVVFVELDSVEKALKLNNKAVPNSKGLILRVDRAKVTRDSTRSVFVGNLPYKANELTLRSHFNDGCGWDADEDAIEGVRIVRDKETMQCKGFGYIMLKDKSYVPAALNLHETTYMKKELRVMVCGKRFKGRKGAPKEDAVEKKGAHRRVANKDKKEFNVDDKKSIMDNATALLTGKKDKKKRGTKIIGVRKSGVGGMSKRAASGKKFDKRVKKIQKRMHKGMGAAKK